jgi:hypothetical protein
MNLNDSVLNDECFSKKIIGAYLIIVVSISLACNSILLLIILKNKENHLQLHKFVGLISIGNILGCSIHLPFVIISTFSCK